MQVFPVSVIHEVVDAEEVKLPWGYVGISLDGLKDVNDKFRGVEGAYDKAMAGIQNCVAVGQRVGLRCTINHHNIQELNNIFDFIERANINPGSVVYFIADSLQSAPKFAGAIRTELGKRLNLIDESRFDFCFIVDFPMYEQDEETGDIIFTHNPFSMPQGGMDSLLNKNPLDILAYQYDLVCNGIELSSGAVRNHDPEIMVKAFEIAGYSEDTIKEKFGALYNAFKFGAPPHAGMAPGVDRMIMLLTNEENIREIIAFPMNSNAQDVMLGSPNEVSEEQLREVHIKIREQHI